VPPPAIGSKCVGELFCNAKRNENPLAEHTNMQEHFFPWKRAAPGNRLHAFSESYVRVVSWSPNAGGKRDCSAAFSHAKAIEAVLMMSYLPFARGMLFPVICLILIGLNIGFGLKEISQIRQN
jgi:hypothetical protein